MKLRKRQCCIFENGLNYKIKLPQSEGCSSCTSTAFINGSGFWCFKFKCSADATKWDKSIQRQAYSSSNRQYLFCSLSAQVHHLQKQLNMTNWTLSLWAFILKKRQMSWSSKYDRNLIWPKMMNITVWHMLGCKFLKMKTWD